MHQSGNEKTPSRLGYFLLSQTQFLDERTVTGDIFGSEVFEQASSLTNHTEQTAGAVEVLLVDLQMLGQGVDTVGKNGYLYLGRTGVAFVGLVLINDLLLDFLLHDVSPFKFFIFAIFTAGGMVNRRVARRRAKVPANREKAEHRHYNTNFSICKEEK